MPSFELKFKTQFLFTTENVVNTDGELKMDRQEIERILRTHTKEEIVDGLMRLEEKYHSVMVHFVVAEVSPRLYSKFLRELGSDNDSGTSDSGLDQKQETDS